MKIILVWQKGLVQVTTLENPNYSNLIKYPLNNNKKIAKDKNVSRYLKFWKYE